MSPQSRLIDFFSPAIVKAMGLIEALETTGSADEPASAVEQQLARLIKEGQDNAVTIGGKKSQEAQDAAFAVTAWIDENLQRHKSWWPLELLQFTLFSTRGAGDDFYRKANQISDSQKELAEVYFVIIGLGFEGRFYRPEVRGQILDAQRQLRVKLPIMPIRPRDFKSRDGGIKHLTPQPYNVPDPPLRQIPANRRWRWWMLAGAVAMVVFVAIGMLARCWLNPDVDQKAVAKDVGEVLKPRECFRLKGSVEDNLFVKVTGRVEGKTQLNEVGESLQGIEGIPNNGINVGDVAVMPRPFCLVVDFLEDNSTIVEDQGPLLFNLKEEYYVTDPLVLKVQAPEGENSFIYVLFVDNNGAAAFLFPHAREPQNQASPGEEIFVGALPGKQTKTRPVWRVGEPMGQAMLIVLAAPSRLLPDPPPYEIQNQEELENLLASLKTKVGESQATKVLSRYKLLEIKPKD